MSRFFLLILCCVQFISLRVSAQNYYLASAGESIFSIGTVDAGDADIHPVLRWSPVLNFQEQLHFDFSRAFGIYTGLGFRNVGLISKVDYNFDDAGTSYYKTATIKERSYSLGLPLLFKLGDMKEGTYFSAGAEAEVMFVYKRKIFEGDSKNKTLNWFDNSVNIFNPSLLAEVHFPKGQYLRFKYYIYDFLNYKGIKLIDGTVLPEYGAKSPLFYVAFGAVTFKKKVSDKTQSISTQTAYFKAD